MGLLEADSHPKAETARGVGCGDCSMGCQPTNSPIECPSPPTGTRSGWVQSSPLGSGLEDSLQIPSGMECTPHKVQECPAPVYRPLIGQGRGGTVPHQTLKDARQSASRVPRNEFR